jgi:hypothetical protein
MSALETSSVTPFRTAARRFSPGLSEIDSGSKPIDLGEFAGIVDRREIGQVSARENWPIVKHRRCAA